MIENIDDILKVVKEIKEATATTTEELEDGEASVNGKKEMIYLVHKHDDLEHSALGVARCWIYSSSKASFRTHHIY
jgi:hypothetical protein